MEVSQAIDELKEYVKVDKEHRKINSYDSDFDKFCDNHIESIEIALKELDRFQKENEKLKEIDLTTVHIKGVCDEKERWRNKIREKIDNRILIVEKILDEMIDKSIGCINTSLLNKKEKEEVINKRNCLTVQKATLEDIKKELLEEK